MLSVVRSEKTADMRTSGHLWDFAAVRREAEASRQ